MARKCTITFGIFSFAGKLDGAIETPPETNTLCPGQPGKDAHDPQPVKQPKVCATCGPITDLTVLKKGVKQASGTYAVIDQEAIAEAKEEYTQQYLGKFTFVPHPAAEVLATTAPGDSLNYLTPADQAGEGQYQLLAKLVAEHPELAFLSLHTPRTATNLFMLSARNGVLVVEKRVRSEKLKPAPSVGGDVSARLYEAMEIQLGLFTQPYEPEAYEDKYAQAIEAMAATAEHVMVGGSLAAGTKVAPVSEEDLIAKLAALGAVAKPKAPARKRAAKKTTTKKEVAA